MAPKTRQALASREPLAGQVNLRIHLPRAGLKTGEDEPFTDKTVHPMLATEERRRLHL